MIMKNLIPKIKDQLMNLRIVRNYVYGRNLLNDPHFISIQEKTKQERVKKPSRTEIINYLLSIPQKETIYLEIGVRNPVDNFNHIQATTKYSVDPGIEFKENPVDFKMTSDEFFRQLSTNDILSNQIKFDVIFIDGLHLAHQVDADIINAMKYLKEDGFIILHDCNPPSEWHSREQYDFHYSPAMGYWNGTTWKAFLKWRSNSAVQTCCIDSDWGVGVITKHYKIGDSIPTSNPFYEFGFLEKNRKAYLNLMEFSRFKEMVK
jgi:hypothetical protein